jgi:RNA exonuclease 1
MSIEAHAANNAISSSSSDMAAAPQTPKSKLNAPKEKAAPAPQFKCRFHPGKVAYKVR